MDLIIKTSLPDEVKTKFKIDYISLRSNLALNKTMEIT